MTNDTIAIFIALFGIWVVCELARKSRRKQ